MEFKTSLNLSVAVAIAVVCLTSSVSSKGLTPDEVCRNFSGVDIRYSEFYELYLGHTVDSNRLEETGIIYRSLKSAVNACCPGMALNFTRVDQLVEDLVLENVLIHHKDLQNHSNHMAFYFPEFSTSSQREIYSHKLPFLRLRKSPGFALVMLKSESDLNVTPSDILIPSWPIFALIISLSWAIGILGWMFDNFSNPDDFPRPFVLGMFSGFWWAIVTMSTVGYGDKVPKSFLARSLAVVWILAGAILLSLFTANATSIITASRIDNNGDTMGKRIGVVNMKNFVEAELNLGANVIDYKRFDDALDALFSREVDRLLFPHYLDLIYIMSNNSFYLKNSLDELYVAKVFDTPFQIGMVLSSSKAKGDIDQHFYVCLEIMTSRFSRQYDYDYSLIDSATAYHIRETFDTTMTKQTLYAILAVIGALVLFGLLFDLVRYFRKSSRKSYPVDSDQQNGVV